MADAPSMDAESKQLYTLGWIKPFMKRGEFVIIERAPDPTWDKHVGKLAKIVQVIGTGSRQVFRIELENAGERYGISRPFLVPIAFTRVVIS